MRREHRLRRRSDFAAVYRRGRQHGNQVLVVRILRRQDGPARFGFVAGKAAGGAVVRNRLKRQLRSAAGAIRVEPGLDIVVSARAAAAEASYQQLAMGLQSLLKRHRALLEEDSDGASSTGIQT